MYKIFINEYPLVITSNERDFFDGGNYRIVDDSRAGLLGAIETLEGSDKIIGSFGLMVMCEDVEKTFTRFRAYYSHIETAGGLVYNEKDELLLIRRQGKWDLPKGKVDKGETIPEAGIREVREECGISSLRIEKALTTSYHTYFLDGQRILKTNHWFQMRALEYGSMRPQTEENITELEWNNTQTLDLDSLDTYNSIRDLLKTVLRPDANN